MHMADALISPAVGGTMWVVTAGLIAYCARKLKQTMKDNLVPMMGVLGAFIFAAQMINFSIPGTGSSGHLGGGLILSVLLGPHAAFLVIASVLTVQALFFADGGLLALGCNIFNLGFFPAFIAYPFIYRLIARGEPWSPCLWLGKPVAGKHGTLRHVARQATDKWIAAIVAAVVGLQLGAFSVVLETKASGISELPFVTFVILMMSIHMAIGIAEGLVTAAVVAFVARTRSDVLAAAPELGRAGQPVPPRPHKAVRPYLLKIPIHLAGLLIAALIIGGAISWFASTHPDGLEWSIAKVTVCPALPVMQDNTSSKPQWPAVTAGTSVAGIVGGLITLGLACLIGFALKARRIKL